MDPIPSLEKKLMAEQMITPEENARMDQLIDKEVEEAFIFAEESPFPYPEEAYQNVYASGVS